MTNFFKRFWKFFVLGFEIFILMIGIIFSIFTKKFLFWLIPFLVFFFTGIAMFVVFLAQRSVKGEDKKKLVVKDGRMATKVADLYLRTEYADMIVTAKPKLTYSGSDESAKYPLWVILAELYYDADPVVMVIDALKPEHVGVFDFDDIETFNEAKLNTFVQSFAENPPKQRILRRAKYDETSGQKVSEIESVEQVGLEAEEFSKGKEEEL